MAQQEVGALGQLVQPGQRHRQPAAAGEREGSTRVRPHTGQGVDAAIVPADLQVQGQSARPGVNSPSVKRISAGRAVVMLIRHPRDCSETKTARPFGCSGASALTGLIRRLERITGVRANIANLTEFTKGEINNDENVP